MRTFKSEAKRLVHECDAQGPLAEGPWWVFVTSKRSGRRRTRVRRSPPFRGGTYGGRTH
jgi:hypothetical protein